MKLDQFVGCALIVWASSVLCEWPHERLAHILKALPVDLHKLCNYLKYGKIV